MLDDRMRLMLEAADTLTEEDLESLRADGPAVAVAAPKRTTRARAARGTPAAVSDAVAGDSASLVEPTPPKRDAALQSPTATAIAQSTPASVGSTTESSSRGAYERSRSRESKTSTACLGEEREKHAWWPLDTEVVGQIGSEFFTAVVVENSNVKSGRSLKITSGPVQGRICITPTRAAMEATEAYRQTHNLGRGGGVTNGWLFWQPRTGSKV